MGAHVFIVDENTFPVHRDRQFCGTGIPGIPSRYEKLLKDPGAICL
jgi:hypothetical protein